MRKDENYWEPVYVQFVDDYPRMSERCVDWYPSAQLEITISLDDGQKYTYDYVTRDVFLLRDEFDDISEGEYRILFGKNLRKRILRAHISQEELEQRIGVSQGMVSRYLNGRSLPNPFIIRRLSRVLQCSVAELIELSI